MSCDSGPIVTDQMPLSSLVIGYDGLPSISPISSTVFAFGALKWNVIVLSGLTTGAAGVAGPRPPPAPRAPGAGAAPACPAGGVGACACSATSAVIERRPANRLSRRNIKGP